MLDVRKLTRYQGRRLQTACVASEPRFLRFGDYTVVILGKPHRPG